jgi:hypothetical protein
LLDFQSVGEAAVLRWQTALVYGRAKPHVDKMISGSFEAALYVVRYSRR